MIKEENIKTIFGLKLKELRLGNNFSLAKLAKISGLSPSYINEIEKGKKYPKSDKIIALAQALKVPYNDMVSVNLTGRMAPIGELLKSNVLQDFPLDVFGLDINKIIDWMSNTPSKINAFISTIIDIAQSYNVQKEKFYFAALRTYREMHNTYFPELEDAVLKFLRSHTLRILPPVNVDDLMQILLDEYNYNIELIDVEKHLDLADQKFLFKEDRKKQLFLHPDLKDHELRYILAKEIGFAYLKISHRPNFSLSYKANNFDLVLNSFRASYFAIALLVNKKNLLNDLESLIKGKTWDKDHFVEMMMKYEVSPELIGQRIMNLLPKFFNVNNILFMRIKQFEEKGETYYEIAGEIHVNRTSHPRKMETKQHYCRRWNGIKILQQLQENNDALQVSVQKSLYESTGIPYISFSIAVPNQKKGEQESISLLFAIDDITKENIAFIDDESIPEVEVNFTCETCKIEDCKDRVVSNELLLQVEQRKNKRERLESWVTE